MKRLEDDLMHIAMYIKFARQTAKEEGCIWWLEEAGRYAERTLLSLRRQKLHETLNETKKGK